jgi:hypothetical protein
LQLEAEMRQLEAEATKERLVAQAPQVPPPSITESSAPSASEPEPAAYPRLPDAEIYPTTFGLEFRPSATTPAPGSELIDPEPVPHEESKGHDA